MAVLPARAFVSPFRLQLALGTCQKPWELSTLVYASVSLVTFGSM
jgi:hypothetical protein